MWILYAFGSAFFAGLTAVLAKCGIEHTNSHLATALRTIVVLIFSWIMVGIVGSFDTIHTITYKTFLFLILSGICLFLILSGIFTGASWLCYFKALQLGNINKVTAIDKTSVVLTIILSFLFFKESVTVYKIIGMIILTTGTYLMVEKKEDNKQTNNAWLLYAVLSVIFASLTTILGKIGITNIESNLGTAIRTSVVLIMSWIVVFVTHSQMNMKSIPKKEYLFIVLSGLATGGSWLCFYHALQSGPASLVTPIDKLSILFTVLFSYLIFHEKLSKKSLLVLILIVSGTLVMFL